MAKWPWRSRSMPPIFNTSCENPKMHIWCKFDDFSSNRIKSYCTNKPKFPEFWVKMAEMILKVKVSIFHTSREYWSVCMFVANLMTLAQIYDELSRGQAKFPRTLSQNCQNDLVGQCQWPLFSIPTESIHWCMCGTNLVNPAQICDELSCGQGKVYGRTDGRTDRRRHRQYSSAWKSRDKICCTWIQFLLKYVPISNKPWFGTKSQWSSLVTHTQPQWVKWLAWNVHIQGKLFQINFLESFVSWTKFFECSCWLQIITVYWPERYRLHNCSVILIIKKTARITIVHICVRVFAHITRWDAECIAYGMLWIIRVSMA